MYGDDWVKLHLEREVVANCPPGGAECVIYRWRNPRLAQPKPARLVMIVWILVVPVAVGATSD